MNEQDEGGWDFAPPPFKADEALAALRRQLRQWGLTERGEGAERRGLRLAEWSIEDGVLHVRMARRPMRTPEWDRKALRSSADQRQWLDDMKRRLDRWEAEE